MQKWWTLRTSFHSERWLFPGNYGRAAVRSLCFKAVCRDKSRPGAGASERMIRYRRVQEAADRLRSPKTKSSGEYGFCPWPTWHLPRWPGGKDVELLPYACENVWASIPASKDSKQGAKLMSYDFLHGPSALPYSRFMHVGKVTLRHSHLLDVVKKLKEGFPPIQCLGLPALEEKQCESLWSELLGVRKWCSSSRSS